MIINNYPARPWQLVWSAVVAVSSTVELDVSHAKTLTLRTETMTPNYWRNGRGLSYGGGPPPALRRDPVRAEWCDGAAWADAILV